MALLVLAVSADRLGLGAGSLNLRTELMAGGLVALILLLRDWRACLRGWGLVDACLGGWLAANVLSSLLFSPNGEKASSTWRYWQDCLLSMWPPPAYHVRSGPGVGDHAIYSTGLGRYAGRSGIALLYNIIGPNFGVLLERFYRDGVFVVTPKIQGVLWEPNIYGSFSLAVAALAGALALRKPTRGDKLPYEQ